MLASIEVAPGNMFYSSIDGVLYNKDCTELLQLPEARQGHFDVPDGVARIGNSAFYKCLKLTSVLIPSSVTAMERAAFSNCTSLTSFTFEGDAPSEIGGSSFATLPNDMVIYFFSGATGFTTPTWNGFSSVIISGADADLDGDGWGHRIELLLETDPGDANSQLRFWLTLSGGTCRLQIDQWSDNCEFIVQVAGSDTASLFDWKNIEGAGFTESRSLDLPKDGDSAFYRVLVLER